MNTRQPIDQSASPLSLSVAFNQDNSCFSVGLDSGFCVFDSDPCEMKVHKDFNAGIGTAEMLGRANFIALVGGGKQPKFAQNKVVIWDDHKSKVVITLEFRSQVLRVRLSRSRIVVALENSVHIYAFSSPPEKLSVFETADNPLGLCCLSGKYVAFPGRTHGQVQVVELESRNVSIIPAHNQALRALVLSYDGETLASASETGTLIRVFATNNCARIAELRRGIDTAKIFSLAISMSGTLLAATSDKSTLHVFDIPSHSRIQTVDTANKVNQYGTAASNNGMDDLGSQRWGILGKIPLLPRAFSDMYSFASVHFEIGDETLSRPGSAKTFLNAPQIPGIPGGRPPKGVIGWIGDDKIILLGAGRDGRWEKFVMATTDEGKRIIVREGWKRYLGAN